MKLTRIIAACAAAVLLLSIAVPVAATGYPRSSNLYLARGSRSRLTFASEGGTDVQDTDRFRPTTTISDAATPLSNLPQTAYVTYSGFVPLATYPVNPGTIYENIGPVDPALLKGLTQTIHMDYKVNGRILARYYINAANFQNVTQTFDLSLSTAAANTSATLNKFKTHFSGNFAVVSMGQKSAFGAPVTMAVSTSMMRGVDLGKLRVLIYSRVKNTYVVASNVRVEGGFAYFTTGTGGELVFTDSSR